MVAELERFKAEGALSHETGATGGKAARQCGGSFLRPQTPTRRKTFETPEGGPPRKPEAGHCPLVGRYCRCYGDARINRAVRNSVRRGNRAHRETGRRPDIRVDRRRTGPERVGEPVPV